jgi:ribonuclease P protein component
MLKRQNRLSSNFQFNVTRKYGTHTEGGFFHLYLVKPTNYEGAQKFGIVVSNKFSKKAVVRNKVKRHYREILFKELNKFIGSFWIVIHPKFSCLDKSYEELFTDFDKTIQKVSLPH